MDRTRSQAGLGFHSVDMSMAPWVQTVVLLGLGAMHGEVEQRRGPASVAPMAQACESPTRMLYTLCMALLDVQ